MNDNRKYEKLLLKLERGLKPEDIEGIIRLSKTEIPEFSNISDQEEDTLKNHPKRFIQRLKDLGKIKIDDLEWLHDILESNDHGIDRDDLCALVVVYQCQINDKKQEPAQPQHDDTDYVELAAKLLAYICWIVCVLIAAHLMSFDSELDLKSVSIGHLLKWSPPVLIGFSISSLIQLLSAMYVEKTNTVLKKNLAKENYDNSLTFLSAMVAYGIWTHYNYRDKEISSLLVGDLVLIVLVGFASWCLCNLIFRTHFQRFQGDTGSTAINKIDNCCTITLICMMKVAGVATFGCFMGLLWHYRNQPEKLRDLVTSVLSKGNIFDVITKWLKLGSLKITLQVKSLSGLKNLRQSYNTGHLRDILEEALVTKEVKALANGKPIQFSVKMDDAEYRNACLHFIRAQQRDQSHYIRRKVYRSHSLPNISFLPRETTTQLEDQDFSLFHSVSSSEDKYDKVVLFHEKSIVLAQKMSNKTAELEAYLALGKIYQDQGKTKDALLCFEKCKNIAKRPEDIQTFLKLAKIYHSMSHHNDAIFCSKFANDLVNQCCESEAENVKMKTSLLLGISYAAVGQNDNAVTSLEDCINIAKRKGRQDIIVEAGLAISKSYMSLKQYDYAVKCLKERLAISKEIRNKQIEMETFFELGQVYSFINQCETAIKNTEKSLDIATAIGNQEQELECYSSLANAYISLNKAEDAIHCTEKRLGMAKAICDKRHEMESYSNLAVAYSLLNRPECAIEYSEKSLQLAKEVGDQRHQMQTYSHLAKMFTFLGQHEAAILNSTKSLEIAKTIDDKKHAMETYSSLSKSHNCLNQDKEAIESSTKSLEIAIEIGDKRDIMESYFNLANTYSSFKQNDVAITNSAEALQLALDIGDKRQEIAVYLLMSWTHLSLNQVKEAYTSIENCLMELKNVNEGEEDMQGIKESYDAKIRLHDDYSVEHIQRIQGKSPSKYASDIKKCHMFSDIIKEQSRVLNINMEISEILANLRRLKEPPQKIDDKTTAKPTDLNKGFDWKIAELTICRASAAVYQSLLCYNEVVVHAKKCLALAEESNIKDVEMKASFVLGNAHAYLSQYDDAIHYLKRSIQLAKEIHDVHHELEASLSLMDIYERTMNFQGLAQLGASVMKSQATERELKSSDIMNVELMWFTAFCTISSATSEDGNDSDLQNRVKTAEDDFDKIQALRMLSASFEIHHHYDKAIESFKVMLEMELDSFQALKDSCCQQEIARCYELSDNDSEAINHYNVALKHTEQCYCKFFPSICSASLGMIYFHRKDMENSARMLLQSVQSGDSFLEELYKAGVDISLNDDAAYVAAFHFHQSCYKMLSEALISLGQHKEALLQINHCQGRALLKRLIDIYGIKDEVITETEHLTFTSIESLVKTNNYSIVLYSIGTEGLHRFCLDVKNGLQLHSQDVKNVELILSLTKLSQCVSHQFEDREPRNMPEDDEDIKALEQLHDLMLGDMDTEQEEIVIVPDGSLFRVPFAALLNKNSDRYLTETKRIRFVPSLSILPILEQNNSQTYKSALVIGNPFVGKVMFKSKERSFHQLQFSEREGQMVAHHLGVNENCLIGARATKPVVLEKLREGVSVVHIAAHGAINQELKPCIALAPSPEVRAKRIPQERDYMLTATEVEQAKVRAQLVVLSTCHGGYGKTTAEGMLSMCRAFLASGSLAVIATLWTIEDQATFEFMTHFYRYLKMKHSASKSLQMAMNDLRKSKMYNEPRYWSPFFLMGEDVTIQFDEEEKQ